MKAQKDKGGAKEAAPLNPQPKQDVPKAAEERPKVKEIPAPVTKPKKPNMTVRLAVCGLALVNEQKRQYSEKKVSTFGQIWIGPYLLEPGKDCAVFYDDVIKDAIAKGLIVNMGVRPR